MIARCSGPSDHSVGPLRQPGASFWFQLMMIGWLVETAAGRCDGGMKRYV